MANRCELFFNGSAYRTSLSTATAANALVSVDHILAITLGDATGGASICTSAARDALIGNLVCHFLYLHKNCLDTF